MPGYLPSAFYRALGKEGFAESRTRQSPVLGKELDYRVWDTQHRETLSKDCFAEWQRLGKDGARQRAVSGRLKLTAVSLCRGSALGKESLPSAKNLALGKDLFTECLLWTLGKAYFYFFNFGNQTFCGMFLHYVDLHVPF